MLLVKHLDILQATNFILNISYKEDNLPRRYNDERWNGKFNEASPTNASKNG